MALTDAGDVDATLRAILVDVLGLDEGRVSGFTEATPLFGSLPGHAPQRRILGDVQPDRSAAALRR